MARGASSPDAGDLTQADFSARINEGFRIYFGSAQPQTVELIEVSELPSNSDGGRQPFSIVLRSQGDDEHHPQGIYSVEHESIGPIEIFLVPIGPDEQGMRYEAIFA